MDLETIIHEFVSLWENHIYTATWKNMLKNKSLLFLQAWLKQDTVFSFR